MPLHSPFPETPQKRFASCARRGRTVAFVLAALLAGTLPGASAALTPKGDPGGLIEIDAARSVVASGQDVVIRVRYEIADDARLRFSVDGGRMWDPKVRDQKVRLPATSLGIGRHVVRAVIVDARGQRIAHGRAAFIVIATKPRPRPVPTPPAPTPPGPIVPPPPDIDTTAPSTPAGLAVTGTGPSGVHVTWNASIDNVGVVGYRVSRSGAPPVVVTGTSTSIGGLACGTSVSVQVAALDAAGNASASASGAGSTAACPPPPPDGTPPTAPANLTVTATGPTSVQVSWSPSTDNVGVVRYRLTRNGAPALDVTGTSTAIGSLPCGASVSVSVVAFDAAGNASASNSASGSTAACPPPAGDTTPPTTPANLSVAGNGQTSVQVSWGASGDNVGVVGYRLTRSGAAPLDVTGTSTAIGGLVCGTSVTVSIIALDAAGNSSPASSATGATAACPPPADTTSPSQPGNLSVAAAGQTAVQVSWSASTDNVGVAGYRVTAAAAAAVDVAGTSTQIGGLACGTSVSVSVVARDAAGNVSTAAGASGSTAACTPPPPPPGAADHYVSPTGNDSAACTQTAPCATFGRAYRAASPGEIVSVEPGNYRSQTIPVDATKTSSSDVVFVGNGASTGEVVVAGSHVTLSNLQTGGWEASPGSDDVTFLNVNVSGGGGLFVTSASNVSVIGGIIDGAGGYVRNGSQVKPASSSSPQPQNVLFDGVTIRNYRKDPSSSDHVDCLHFMSGAGITIRNSSFSNCEHFDILFTKYLGPTPSNVLIENNFFRCCGAGYYSVQLGGDHGEAFVNFVIRNNSADKGMTVGGNGSNTLSNVAFYNNNVPGIGGCDRSGVTANFNNLFSQGSKCGPNDQLSASGFVSSTDLHLAAGAPSIDKASPAQAPGTDIDGEARPKGAGPDIGADER